MLTLVTLARRYQLPGFFLLAYALSWWAWVWYRLDPETADAPFGSPRPSQSWPPMGQL